MLFLKTLSLVCMHINVFSSDIFDSRIAHLKSNFKIHFEVCSNSTLLFCPKSVGAPV